MTIEPPLRLGIVGLGKMGIMHACLLNTFPNVVLAGLCDKSRLMRNIAKQPFKNAVVTDDLEKFSSLALDAVFVLTPIPSHYPIIKQIYEKKIAKNVFVEKTLSSSYSQSKELQASSERLKSVSMVGYMKRFAVTFNLAKSLLEQQVLGDLSSFYTYAFSSDFTSIQEGSTLPSARGGVLEDLGSHVMDLALWFFGNLRPTNVTINSGVGSEDDLTFSVKGKDGLEGKFDVSWRKPEYRMPEFGFKIHGSRGKLSVNDDEVCLELDGASTKRWYRPDMDDNVGFLLGAPEYYREDQHYLDALTANVPLKVDFKEALKVDLLIDQVRQLWKN
ncbi:MAG: Gfo/Idh/MocA family protein [Methanocella sp.]|jgi:predicted dehydrogenase